MRVDKVSIGEFLNDVGEGTMEATGDLEGMFPVVLSGVDVKVDNGTLEVKNGGIINIPIIVLTLFRRSESTVIATLFSKPYKNLNIGL